MLVLNELKISRDKILSLDINKIRDIEKEKYRKELKKINELILILELNSKTSLEQQLILVNREYDIILRRRDVWLENKYNLLKFKDVKSAIKHYNNSNNLTQKLKQIKLLKEILK